MGQTKAQKTSIQATKDHVSARATLKSAIAQLNKARADNLPEGALSSKQEPEEGGFNKNVLDKNKLLVPPYDPSKLYSMVENSQILPQCIDAMVKNIHGFGYDFLYSGDSRENKVSDAELTEKKNITLFLQKVNEKQSITALNMEMHEDLEKTGNGYIEIIRDKANKVTLMYRTDARTIRLQAIQDEAVPTTCEFFRHGKVVNLKVYKRFRKYAMISGKKGNKTTLVWFKEFGDPRPMSKVTGEYADIKAGEAASEILHFKIGTDTYGIPRWSGQVLVTLGMHYAEFVNYDLFSNQVVPPLAIMVSGGVLTAESVKDIKDVLVSKKGVYNFNKVLLLESASNGTISEKDSAHIELKELSQARKEDAMFTEYTDKGDGKIRSAFRLPPMITGKAESYSKSTAESSKQVAEEQVFVPERRKFDEIMNTVIMPELGATVWEYTSQAPKLLRGQDMTETFNNFARHGAFTINQSIRLANRLLSMDIKEYDAEVEWANMPISIVMEYAKQGTLNIDNLNMATDNLADLLLNPENTDDPEKAAELYAAFNQLTTKLKNIQIEKEKKAKQLEM